MPITLLAAITTLQQPTKTTWVMLLSTRGRHFARARVCVCYYRSSMPLFDREYWEKYTAAKKAKASRQLEW